ncbi:YqzL family protein [Paludifilum halophilum]|uniref:YqzL family protein n=1 Tax=Paludifilum halophilum TaxID=1642702 RepID=A0A235B5U3_9BACL|nr:YqzL family protein [Paludifilum halophilum]OYD07676.1 YqzL family protein [Paludifilum halophilum]
MRSFSWNCFAMTGNIDAYLLYKDTEALSEAPDQILQREKEEEVEA